MSSEKQWPARLLVLCGQFACSTVYRKDVYELIVTLCIRFVFVCLCVVFAR